MSNNTLFDAFFVATGVGVIGLFLRGAIKVAKEGMHELYEHDKVKKSRKKASSSQPELSNIQAAPDGHL